MISNYLAQISKSSPTQQALSDFERRASPQRELMPDVVKPRTSATPFSITYTLMSVMPSKICPFGLRMEKEPPFSLVKIHLPL